MEHTFYLIQDLALIVIFSTAFTWLFSALRLPILLGFITVGILLAPVLGMLHDTENIVELGELGVLFMMFFVGMEFNPDRLKKVFAPSFLGISAQILAMGALGMVAARIMGMTSLDGVFLGGVLAMSSTVVIMEIFEQRGVLNKMYAQIAVGVLIIEDLFAIFLLVVLSSLAQQSGVDFGRLGESVLMLTTFVVTIYVVGKLLVAYLVKRFTALENSQAMIMFVFCAVLGLSQLAHLAGLSQPLGAFLAGSILSGTKIATRIEHLTSPFRNLFVALFFVSVGTMIQPGLILELWLPILAISACVVVFQTAACFTGIVLGGASAKDAYFGAINKAQIGEFSFVIASLGISLGVMNPKIMAIAMGVSFLTVFVNPFLSSHAQNVTDFFDKNSPKSVHNIFDRYKNAVARIGGASSGNTRLKRILPPAVSGFVYFFIFNAIMVVTVFVFDWMDMRSITDFKYVSMSIWIGNAVISLPLLIGLLASGELFVISLFKIKRRELSRWGARIFRFSMASILALLIAAAYFAILSHYFPTERDILYHMGLVFALIIIFGPALRRLNLKIELKFAEIFRRHLENAEHHKHEIMLKKIRTDYAWAPDISEVKIPEGATVAGKTMRQISVRENSGSDVVAIKRGEFVVYDVMADTHVFPGDTIILSGQSDENDAARELLTQISEGEEDESDSLGVALLKVPENSPILGKSLSELQITKSHSVKALAMGGANENSLGRPDIHRPMQTADTLMLLGPQDNIDRLKKDFHLQDV